MFRVWLLRDKSRVPPKGFRYQVPETGVDIRASNDRALLHQVSEHYRGNNLEIPDDLSDRIEDWICHQLNEPYLWCEGEDMPGKPLGKGGFDGAALWADLHTRAFTAPAGHDDTEWLKAFRKRIPCRWCRWGWTLYIKFHPPDFDNYFEWTVNVHNYVNHRLGRRQWTMEEALDRWA